MVVANGPGLSRLQDGPPRWYSSEVKLVLFVRVYVGRLKAANATSASRKIGTIELDSNKIAQEAVSITAVGHQVHNWVSSVGIVAQIARGSSRSHSLPQYRCPHRRKLVVVVVEPCVKTFWMRCRTGRI